MLEKIPSSNPEKVEFKLENISVEDLSSRVSDFILKVNDFDKQEGYIQAEISFEIEGAPTIYIDLEDVEGKKDDFPQILNQRIEDAIKEKGLTGDLNVKSLTSTFQVLSMEESSKPKEERILKGSIYKSF